MRGPEGAPPAVGVNEKVNFGSTPLSPEQFTPQAKPAKSTAVQIERTIGKVKVGGTAYIGDTKAYAEAPKPLPKPAMGTVARSEAAHAFVAITKGIEVELITIEHGPGYLGMVRTSKADADVMAAHLETEGSGSDREKLVYLMRVDPDTSHRRAQQILKNDPEGYDTVTRVVEKERTTNGDRLIQAIEEEKERKELVLLEMRTPNGRVTMIRTQAVNGEVEVEEIKLPLQDTVFDANLIKANMELAA